MYLFAFMGIRLTEVIKMYKIEQKDFGFKLTLDGVIDESEMIKWVSDSEKALQSAPSKFGVFVDMRSLKPLSQEAQAYMQKGQILYKQKGMTRSVVILNNAVLTLQFTNIAEETGIYEWERYIDASKYPDWEAKGIAWIVSAADPDK